MCKGIYLYCSRSAHIISNNTEPPCRSSQRRTTAGHPSQSCEETRRISYAVCHECQQPPESSSSEAIKPSAHRRSQDQPVTKSQLEIVARARGPKGGSANAMRERQVLYTQRRLDQRRRFKERGKAQERAEAETRELAYRERKAATVGEHKTRKQRVAALVGYWAPRGKSGVKGE